MKRRFLSTLLALCLLLALLPTTLAAEGEKGTQTNPYSLTELGTMTRDQYINAQERLGGTMYVSVGTYSYDTNGVLGNGRRDDTLHQTEDRSVLNGYNSNGYLGAGNDGANGKNIVFVGGSITSDVTGYASIDNIGTSLLLAVPAYTNVTFQGITFNNVFNFDYQLYTGPWSQLGELKFDDCTFNGIIVGSVAAQTLTFNGCTFTNYVNSVSANNSNPTWIRPAYGNWVKGDNTQQGNDFRSLTKVNFTNNNVTSTRPVKFEYISQWDITSTVTATDNYFDISAQTTDGADKVKNVGLYLGAHTDANAFNLVVDNNTKSANTAALYTIPEGKTSLPAGSTVKDRSGNDVTLTDALKWKGSASDALTLKTTQAFEVGGVGYTTLADALAALNADNHTLTLNDDNAWPVDTPVYWKAGAQSGYAATLTAALTAAYKANADDITIVCRPNADVGALTHGHVADNLTIYGNDAYISDGECDLEVDTFKFSRATGAVAENGAYLEKDITITAYELDNLGVWGQRHTAYEINVFLTDCDGRALTGKENGQRVYISGTTGVNNIRVTDCDFLTAKTALYSNADGTIVIDGCSFTGSAAPANFNHKANGTQSVEVKNSTFTGCGDNGEWKQFAAPIRFVNSGSGKMNTSVDNTTITGTVGGNGDILLGDGRKDQDSNDVSLTVSGTAANVQAQQPGYYDENGKTTVEKVSKTGVAETETKTIELKNGGDFKLIEVDGREYSSVADAITAAQSGGKLVTLLTADDTLLQAILDGQYGSIDGLTIELPGGSYGRLELGRATADTKGGITLTCNHTDGTHYSFTTAEAYKEHIAENVFHYTSTYTRSMNNVTIVANGDVTVNGILMESGHLHQKANPFRDGYTGYYMNHKVSNFTFKGIKFAGNVDINTSSADTVIEGFTFDNCTFTTNGTTSDKGQAIRYYNENNNGQVKNLVVKNCTFTNCYQGVYTRNVCNVSVTNSSFNGTGHNAIAIQDGAVFNHGTVVITGNTFNNVGNRIIRFNNVGADTQITITYNTAVNSGDSDGEVIKATTLADGVTYTVHSNSWGEGKKVANDQLKDTAAPVVPGPSGSSVSTSATKNGSVTVSPRYAAKGTTVTVTVKPDSGYTLETITVTDAKGNSLPLTAQGDGKYTFTMPDGSVTVKATFMEDNSLLNFFYDVPNSAYYFDAVKWAVEKGVTEGVGSGLFGPDRPCTRAQIVTFLWRAAGSPAPKGTASFTDVSADAYYAQAVTWAVESGITEGMGDGKFSPEATCTRAQAVTFLCRACGTEGSYRGAFTDVTEEMFCAGSVAWAVANGITDGVGGSRFAPADSCTRAQIVTFLYRAYQGK